MSLTIPIPSRHPLALSPDSPGTPVSPMSPEQPSQNLKGKRRLLGGFHRISSSSSLKLSRSNSSAYKNRKAAVSCISLNTGSLGTPLGSPLSPSLSTELASGYSTDFSAAPTPGVQIPIFDDRARLRYLDKLNAHASATLPARLAVTPTIREEGDYFSIPVRTAKPQPTRAFNFWRDLPSEICTNILSYLSPKQVIRCSAVSRAWHKQCFDGQLWAVLDTAEFYQHIPAKALVALITSAGPFIRDLNLRGCVQLREKWNSQGLAEACKNLEYFSLEGCRIDRSSIHRFMSQNPRLIHINLTGLSAVTNNTLKLIAQHCPRLEHLNVSWCNNVDTRGLYSVVESCKYLTDLRAGEVSGWGDLGFAQLLHDTNRLETLAVMSCESLTDEAFKVMIHGTDPEIDFLTDRPMVPPRKLRFLDMSGCRNVTDAALRAGMYNLDELEGFRLAKCAGLTDLGLIDLLPTLPKLTHLDLEEIDALENPVLQALADSPCAPHLRHLSISYCESLGDVGMLAVLKTCTSLSTLDMDNTRISDLVLAECAALVRRRSPRTTDPRARPTVSLRIVAYDCQNVTWTGVREILSRNAEVAVGRTTISSPTVTPVCCPATPVDGKSAPCPPAVSPDTVALVRTYPAHVIHLKCFYNYQPTVHEHYKRVSRGDWAAAQRLERKWAEFMVAHEEAGALGAGHRRRRRRAREAQMMHADEAEEGVLTPPGGGVGGGRRRRARSGGCAVM